MRRSQLEGENWVLFGAGGQTTAVTWLADNDGGVDIMRVGWWILGAAQKP